MTILFTPAGTTDPVRGYHDGAILHILRHYDVDKVILFLTKEMGDKEKGSAIYTKGIASVASDKGRPIDVALRFHDDIENPQRFEELVAMQADFDEAYREAKDARWLLNTSSGTPQMKTVMALLAIDYPDTTAIQVDSPERQSNIHNAPERETGDMALMVEYNEDRKKGAPNRCHEQSLRLLRKYGLSLQIESLIDRYEYGGAAELLRRNQGLFSDTIVRLLRHGMLRASLLWKEANKEISQVEGKSLIQSAGDFQEYFLAAEIRRAKGELADYIVKLSPLLMDLGETYLKNIPGFSIEDCCWYDRGGEKWKFLRDKANRFYPELVQLIETERGNMIRDMPLNFDTIAYMAQYLAEKPNADEKVVQVADLFRNLRQVEANVRNKVAHTITNLTEEKLKAITGGTFSKGMDASAISRLLHEAVRLIKGKDIRLEDHYGRLNVIIKDQLKKDNKPFERK